MKNLLPHIIIVRPLNVLAAIISILLSSIITQYDGHSINIIYATLVVIFFTAGANTLNDFFDYEIDIVNRPNRPLSSGKVPKNYALIYSILYFIIGLFFAYQLNYNSKIVSIFISFPLLILYNYNLKGYPLIGNIVVALILSLTFVFAGYVFNNITPMIIPSILAFGLTLIREVIKDIADIKGDRKVGLKTFPIIFGKEKSFKLCVVLSVLFGLGAFIPFINGYYNMFYGVLLILTVEIPLAKVVILIINKPSIAMVKKSADLLKISTFGGLLSILAGTV